MRELEQAPPDGSPPESLLLWEADRRCVALPRSGRLALHVHEPAPPELPVLRRESGGGAVLLGPGCLNYALVLSLERRPSLLDVELSYQAILGALLSALCIKGAHAIGSDLVLGDRKFGGHAQRRTRRSLLHHGTILYTFDLSHMDGILREPQRQPPYRAARPHSRFLVNAPVSRDLLLDRFSAFAAAWD